MLSTSCHMGTLKGIRASITMGLVKGIMENQNTSWLSGALKAYRATKKPSMSGMVMGSCSWELSPSFSTALPIAANRDAYRRYQKMKKNRNAIPI